jgi:CO/xanthine dehydrogenase Mo-binding subunit
MVMKTNSFLEDIFPENLLYAKTIRSPVSKGYLKYIIYPKLPENYYFITARHIPGENRFGDSLMPVLAERKLSYIGEPVAIMLGKDKTKLEKLALMCIVAADEEKPIFSCEEAEKEENGITREIHIGDHHGIYQNNGKIVTGSYLTGIQDHWYAEPAGAVTWFVNKQDNDKERKKITRSKTSKNTLIVKTATQWPYHVKNSIIRVLALDHSVVSVEPTLLSLHMDGKFWFPSLIACHAALGTYITKYPVRLILNRDEDFYFSPKRAATNIDIISNIDEDGNITASEANITVNLGAYWVNGNEILDQICLGCIGNYNIGSYKLTAKVCRTNIPPQGPFTGFGMPHGLFAIERHISLISDIAGIDPAQWRNDHINTSKISKNQKPGSEIINFTAKMGDYYRKWASYELLKQSHNRKIREKGENPRGIGIAFGIQGNNLLYSNGSPYTVEVTLTKESILEIKTSISSSENYDKIWGKIAAGILSINPDMVRVVTENAPDCGPSCASRNITVISKTVENCCQAIRKQRFHTPLPITVRRFIKPQKGELCASFFPPPSGKIMDVSGFSKLAMACAVVEVSIELSECVPKVRGVWLGIDGGKIISVNRAKRSLARSAVQALGWAFTECIEYTNGFLPENQYANFTIPSPADIPPVNIDFFSHDVEAKGIGELPFTCVPAAFLQAVSQAMDHSFKSIPLKRKEIWEIVRIRNYETQAQVSK